ncbi:MAG: hypothetical protein N2036_15480 [Bryobacteraceae bacterium]|nr:hypothetical protein [Bryobacteraceae bacterium]MCX7605474.1 hypothetical protein [Bryobacteraceae bacterium]
MNRRAFLGAAPMLIAAQAQKTATPPLAEEIEAFGLKWQVISAADWRVEPDELHLVTARPQQANPRRPIQFALARTEPLARFTLEVDVRRSSPKGSLILVYAWQKDGYFNYVHLSDDAASQVEVHNGVFHCFGGDRVRISPLEGPGSLPTADWHSVRMQYDAATGQVEAWVDGRTSPSLKAVDLSLGAGRIGLGSFFNTASFRRFRLRRG